MGYKERMRKVVVTSKQHDCVGRKYKKMFRWTFRIDKKKFRKDTTCKVCMYYSISATAQLENLVLKKMSSTRATRSEKH